jgi:hypothetical protein
MTNRLYVLKPKGLPGATPGPRYLVSAPSRAAVFSHAARETWEVAPAKPTDVADILQAGGSIALAGEEAPTTQGELV